MTPRSAGPPTTLIRAAGREVPAIGLALQAVEGGLGTLTVETSIGPNGPTSTLVVFDDGVTAPRVLLTAGRSNGSAEQKRKAPA